MFNNDRARPQTRRPFAIFRVDINTRQPGSYVRATRARGRRRPRALASVSYLTPHTHSDSSADAENPRVRPGCSPHFSAYSVDFAQLSTGCQHPPPSERPRPLRITKCAFKMSLSPQRAKVEATNRCALFVPLTLAWTPTLLSFVHWRRNRRHSTLPLVGETLRMVGNRTSCFRTF